MDPTTLRLIQGAAGAAASSLYVDDVFITFLYEGTGTAQTITNGIDLAGEGGMVWLKNRSNGGSYTNHSIVDSERVGSSGYKSIYPNLNSGEFDPGDAASAVVTTFNSNGFATGGNANISNNGGAYASWNFRKAPGFFDCVTYTGDGTDGRQIAHNLGSAPGCVIIKRTDSAIGWAVYHRSQTTTYGELNSTNAFATSQLGGYNMQEVFGDSSTVILPDASNITVARYSPTNASGGTYVAYIFAHDEPVFGTGGNESIIKCGSYTGNGSSTGPVIDLGFEPQWWMIKRTDVGDVWGMYDNMRGAQEVLRAESDSAEVSSVNFKIDLLANGFQPTSNDNGVNASGGTYIYMAIRRPNKPPTAGTEVFKATLQSSANPFNVGFPTDMAISAYTASAGNKYLLTRLTNEYLLTDTLAAASTAAQQYFLFDLQNSYQYGGWLGSTEVISYNFKRAPGFMDVVPYTASNQVTQNITHNLNAEPELIIFKCRSNANQGWVYVKDVGVNKVLQLDGDIIPVTSSTWLNNTAPTSSVFTVGRGGYVNYQTWTYIAYLFATLPGISKVGSYSGTAATLNVDCGFSSGARFILIKRTDVVGDWYVWDTARGIVSGNDPYLLLNSTAAEVTNTDYIDPLSSGFTVTSSAPAALNASGGSYIFLAIA